MNTYDVDQAAIKLNTDPTTIRALIDDGKLPAAKIGRAWVIMEEDLIEYLRARIREQTAERIERTANQLGRARNKSEASNTRRYQQRKTLPDLSNLSAG